MDVVVCISFVGSYTKIENKSDFNIILSLIPEGKRKLRDECIIQRKSFLILNEKIDLTKIYMTFNDG